jgi:hypothetical protein
LLLNESRQHGENTLGIIHDVVVGEAEDDKTSGLDEGVAHRIVRNALLSEVTVTVDLDNQLYVMTSEIDDIRADGNLLAKMHTASPEWIEQPP